MLRKSGCAIHWKGCTRVPRQTRTRGIDFVKAVSFDPFALPSCRFQPRIYGVGAWTDHIFFAYDLAALERPRIFVELGTDRGESYFAFCQSAAENQTATRCFAVDTWKGDAQSGFYDETTFEQVCLHNHLYYRHFSTLLRCTFDDALTEFADGDIDVLHLDGLHTESAVRHDLKNWLPKLRAGGILLLHDVCVRSRDFGVWKIWDELKLQGRSAVFAEGPGLGLWGKPPLRHSGFLNAVLNPNDEYRTKLRNYYSARVDELRKRIALEWQTGAVRQGPLATETVIQVFYSRDGLHRETDSVNSRLGHNSWKNVSINLPADAGTAPLRIDFVNPLSVIDIAALRVLHSSELLFEATTASDFDQIDIRGDAERLAHPKFLRLKITGVDPQLYLPPMSVATGNAPVTVEMRLRVNAEAIPPN